MIMNKQELAERLAYSEDLSKTQALGIVNSVFEIVAEGLDCDEDVSIAGFGKFTVKATAPRRCRNPQTGEEIDVPSKRAVKFKPAQGLKDLVNGY